MSSVITSVVTSAVTMTVTATASTASASSTNRAAPQAGILEGQNPLVWAPSNPIMLFIIQAAIVIIFCQLLHYPLRLLGQPRVIAEVVGGIMLGPSVMSRIPNFKDTIFPTASMPVFNNVANLGLIIYLFQIALEVDMRQFTQNWRVALSVSVAGMILPFAMGCGVAHGIYNTFPMAPGMNISFGVFALFIGTALAITAFPVLCRILTALKLLRTGVGTTTLAAGIGNDVTGWILLALCVALVNNSSGLAALWALLCTVGWALFLVFGVRPVFMWILRRTGSLQNGPTQGMVALTLLMTLVSAWFTGAIGVHPIFGGFLVGLICPHDGGFAIKMTEKIEDFIAVIFLPLYFALSGLSTNLGLLNDGISWAYVVAVTVIAFSGKIIGGTLAARANRLLWRESLTIGVLMSCKGLVELIVLNIGFNAGILSQKTFTMFVVMALVTTVATTPLTKWLYPYSYQKKVERWRAGEIDWDGNSINGRAQADPSTLEKLQNSQVRRLLVYLRLDSLPSLFTIIALLGEPTKAPRPAIATETEETTEEAQTTALVPKKHLEVHGLRILELTERTSSVMRVTEGEGFYAERDPVVNTFRTFSSLNDLAVSGTVAVAPTDSYAETLMSQAHDVLSDFVLIPWAEYGSITEDQSVPFSVASSERFQGRNHLEFVQQSLQRAISTATTGIFINNGFGGALPRRSHTKPGLSRHASKVSVRSARDLPTLPVADKSHHIFVPFFGGVDDRKALQFALQLAKNNSVSVTVARFTWPSTDDTTGRHSSASGAAEPVTNEEPKSPTSLRVSRVRDSQPDTHGKMVEDISAQDLALLSTLQNLSHELSGRVVFTEVSVPSGIAAAILAEVQAAATRTVGQSPKNAGDLIIAGRRHVRLGDAASESAGSSVADFKGTVGVVAERMIANSVKASVLVVQAGGKGLEI